MTGRIAWIDIGRSIALVGMIVYHFGYDLATFGLVSAQSVISGPMRLLAIVTAGSFIAIAGVSLQVAHGQGIRWAAFWRRIAILAAAALAITTLTYLWAGPLFIFFGILHAIALFSLLGLAALRLSWWATLACAVGTLALPFVWSHPVFDAPFLLWTGLGTSVPATLDYEPVFPWFGAFLGGMALAKAADGTALMQRRPLSGVTRLAALPGQHSLLVYLVHQPILIALIWLWVTVWT